MSDTATLTPRVPHTRTVPFLAGALLTVELLAGMQIYLSETVLPLVAADLGGADWYGILNASGQAALFLTIPLGGWLLARYRIAPLLLCLTLVTVVGAILGATAPAMWVFVTGDVLRSLAAGALATVSMGAISRGFPPRYRQLVLAGMSGAWVISSMAGPAYAAAVSSALGWRWAMLVYLPLLLAARAMVARFMPPQAEEPSAERAPVTLAALLASGALLLALPLGRFSLLTIAAGGMLLVGAVRRLMPAGSLLGHGGRPAALSALFATTGVYFGATLVISVVAHDAFGFQASEFALLIAAPGFTWAVVGLWCGARPAEGDSFRRRLLGGGAAIAVGIATMLAATAFGPTLGAGTGVAGDPVWLGLLVGGSVAGTGMGLIYPDLLGRCFTPPDGGDGIGDDHMASSVVLAEATGTTLVTAVAFTWLGTGMELGVDLRERTWILYLVLTALSIPMLRRLSAAARPA